MADLIIIAWLGFVVTLVGSLLVVVNYWVACWTEARSRQRSRADQEHEIVLEQMRNKAHADSAARLMELQKQSRINLGVQPANGVAETY